MDIQQLIKTDPVCAAMASRWGEDEATALLTEAIALRDQLMAQGWTKADFAKELSKLLAENEANQPAAQPATE